MVNDAGRRRVTRVSVHQPNFLPWTKLFDKVLGSDVYIAYDSVQYTRSEFHSRQLITGRDGPLWLSVAVLGSVYAGDDRLLVDFNLHMLCALLDYVGGTVRVARATFFFNDAETTE